MTVEASLTLALIFIVMVTLVHCGGCLSPPQWASNLVAASLGVLVLLPLLASPKNLHILLSPVALFLKRPGFSQIPALTDADDVGLATGLDITRLAALQAYSCVDCARCTEHCPAYNTGKELDPRMIALGLNYYMDQYGLRSDSPILATPFLPRRFRMPPAGPVKLIVRWHSTFVDDCRLAARRREHQRFGKTQMAHSSFKVWRNTAMPWAFQKPSATALWRHQAIAHLRWFARVLFVAGLHGRIDPRGRAIIKSFVEIMQHLGTWYWCLEQGILHGDPARQLGNDPSEELANIHLRLRSIMARLRLFPFCPHCVRTPGRRLESVTARRRRPCAFGRDDRTPREFLARHADRFAVAR